jgi:hypothetical protein
LASTLNFTFKSAKTINVCICHVWRKASSSDSSGGSAANL